MTDTSIKRQHNSQNQSNLLHSTKLCSAPGASGNYHRYGITSKDAHKLLQANLSAPVHQSINTYILYYYNNTMTQFVVGLQGFNITIMIFQNLRRNFKTYLILTWRTEDTKTEDWANLVF